MRVLDTATRQRGKNTPWGMAEHTETYGEGITFCSTSSHGGFKLSTARMAVMEAEYPLCLRVNANTAAGWFEEDCDWCLVALAFPSVFASHCGVEALEHAQETARAWHPVIAARAFALGPLYLLERFDASDAAECTEGEAYYATGWYGEEETPDAPKYTKGILTSKHNPQPQRWDVAVCPPWGDATAWMEQHGYQRAEVR